MCCVVLFRRDPRPSKGLHSDCIMLLRNFISCWLGGIRVFSQYNGRSPCYIYRDDNVKHLLRMKSPAERQERIQVIHLRT